MNNSKLDFNLPTLKHYSEEQAWNFLREFDRTPRSLRQNQLNYLTFDYTNLYQPNKDINEAQITYDNDSSDEEEA